MFIYSHNRIGWDNTTGDNSNAGPTSSRPLRGTGLRTQTFKLRLSFSILRKHNKTLWFDPGYKPERNHREREITNNVTPNCALGNKLQ